MRESDCLRAQNSERLQSTVELERATKELEQQLAAALSERDEAAEQRERSAFACAAERERNAEGGEERRKLRGHLAALSDQNRQHLDEIAFLRAQTQGLETALASERGG